jgi:hypothetical protein
LGRHGGILYVTHHARLVEEGAYLWRCLGYIELNTVRCRRVAHPSEWDWLPYHEIKRSGFCRRPPFLTARKQPRKMRLRT